MKTKNILTAVCLLGILIFGSCSEDVIHQENIDVYIMATKGSNYFYAYGSVKNTNIFPHVKINDVELMPSYSLLGLDYFGKLNINETNLSLNVSAENISGSSFLDLPGEFDFTIGEVDSIYTDTRYLDLAEGEDLNIAWSLPEKYTYLDFILFINGWYFADGNLISFIIEIDTIFNDTTFFISKNDLFPANMDSLYHISGYMQILAINGPSLDPNSKGNISGNVNGYFWAGRYTSTMLYLHSKKYLNNNLTVKERPNFLDKAMKGLSK